MSKSLTMDDIFNAFHEIVKQEIKPDTIIVHPTLYQQMVDSNPDVITEEVEFTFAVPILLKNLQINILLDDTIHEQRKAEPIGTQLEFDFGEDK